MSLNIIYVDNTTQTFETVSGTDATVVDKYFFDPNIRFVRTRNLATYAMLKMDATNFQSIIITDSTNNVSELFLPHISRVTFLPTKVSLSYIDGTSASFSNTQRSVIRRKDWFSIVNQDGSHTYIPMSHILNIHFDEVQIEVTTMGNVSTLFVCGSNPLNLRRLDNTLLSDTDPNLFVLSLEVAPLISFIDINNNIIRIPEYKIKSIRST
jgi:hypothetical protein